MAGQPAWGILGGTFDPIHYGHLVAAECSRHEFGLEKVIFIPSARPPHKELEGVLTADHRLRMVELAIKDNSGFAISTLEMERSGTSFTVDTIQYLVDHFPGVIFYFIMGMDSLLLMDTWHNYRKLAILCRFIIVTRPGYRLDRTEPRLAKLPEQFWDQAHLLEIPGMDISSTDIRERIAAGRPIGYLVPGTVEAYIREHGLYLPE